MIYLEYEDFRMKYIQVQRKYDQLLTDKENLFDKTQPHGVRFDTERVGGTMDHNAFDDYLIQMERKRLEERLADIKSVMEERWDLLKTKEVELRESSDISDRLYVMRFLDHMKMRNIMDQMNYSQSNVYRLLDQVIKEIKILRENERISES